MTVSPHGYLKGALSWSGAHPDLVLLLAFFLAFGTLHGFYFTSSFSCFSPVLLGKDFLPRTSDTDPLLSPSAGVAQSTSKTRKEVAGAVEART